MNRTEHRLCLSPAEYIDSDDPQVIALAESLTSDAPSPIEEIRALYGAVRDRVSYSPYVNYDDPESYRASSVLRAGTGYCVGKAALFAALCRAAGYPARVGLADVRNHLSTGRLSALVGTDVFAYHGYTEVQVDGHWLKASPTFNVSLCQKLGVAPLEFDGRADALLQPYDATGREFMEYLVQHGSFFDVPAKFLMAEMARLYPALCHPGRARGETMESDIS